MVAWRALALVALAAVGIQAQELNSTDFPSNATRAGVVRRLGGSAPGNIAACYTPFHNTQYPLFGGAAAVNQIRAAIEDDFRLLSKFFTHVRTYYSQHYGIEVAPIAAKYGVKLYLGVYMTSESWGASEEIAAANAIKNYYSTVEVVLAGNENMIDFQTRSWDIINKINSIKSRAGGDAWRVKYGTVQRINEYLDNRFDWDMQQLTSNLDILGVNIYPFFDNNYNSNNPAFLLNAQWNAMVNKYPKEKIRLTETGFPTAGAPSYLSPRVQPSVDGSFKYYEGLLNWWPSGSESYPKFWFQAFDRRYGDPAAPIDLERYFGFFTTEKNPKRDNFPRLIGSSDEARSISSSSSSSCTIEEGADYPGNDISNAKSSTAEGCFTICSSVSNCGAFTWTAYNGGTCWLKSSKGRTSSNDGVRSGVACKCGLGAIESNTDYAGNDIGNAPSSSAEGCVSKCQTRSNCGAFTWTSYNGGTCWLKSSKGSTSWSNGAKSAVMCQCGVGSMQVGVDFSGNDIGNTYSSNAQGCFSICQARSDCKAFTWTSHNGGTCWLKSAKGSSSSNGAATSGVLC